MKLNTPRLLSKLMRWAAGTAVLAAPVAIAAPPADPGYLFYTPAQRTQLEQARARNITTQRVGAPASEPAPLRYDGTVIRSDGRTTHWIDGRPQAAPGGAAGLKPGQVRTDGRILEPYQVLRPTPAPVEKPAPAMPDRRPRESAEPAP